FAKRYQEQAEAQTSIADSRRLAALSVSVRNKRLDLSLLLAAEALHTDYTFEARDSLYKALQERPGLESFFHAGEGAVTGVAFSPDGKALAAGCVGVRGGGVVLWDVAKRQRLAEAPLRVDEGEVYSVAFSRNGRALAAGYSGNGDRGGVVLWDVAARR